MTDRNEAAFVAPDGGGGGDPGRDRSTMQRIGAARPRARTGYSSGGAGGVMYFGGAPEEDDEAS